MNLLTLLAEKNIIGKRDVAALEAEAASSGESVETLLTKRGIDSAEILAAKGEYLKVPTRILGAEETIPFEVLKYIPEESATHYRFVPLGVKDGVLEVGIVDPDNIEALDALSFIAAKVKLPFKAYLISEADFARVIEMYKGLSGEVSKALSELQTELKVDDEALPSSPGGEPIIKEDAPVTKMVATILRYAVEGRASDIHVEPMRERLRVRFRVDGVLHTSLTLPLAVARAVAARVKILSSMKLDERRKPQDGRFSATVSGRKVDFRVSTFPSYYGEKVVMRILDQEKGTITLEKVGLSPRNLALVREAIERPYGLILISGPTGSGKSTTLYGMLNEINREERNVISLEDPVEYSIDGMSQSQVHPEIGYTFATGLRSVLRQDPDIIMVGEIRDKETAQLAVQAALTGHLVFSTVHTNNAIGVIPRLIDMGVDPYLIAPTLVLMMAQRLVRTLCPGGGRPIPIEGSLKAMLEKQFADLPEEFRKEIPKAKEVYGIEPSPECPDGTRGRTGVFELIPMNKDLENAILKNPVEEELYAIARRNGMLTMKEDALLKAFERVIPFEEVNALGGELLAVEEE